MRQNRANSCGDRSNALWGRGSRGEARSNALWGRGGRRAGATVLMAAAAFSVMAAVSVASPGTTGSATGDHSGLKAYVEDSLLADAQQNPKQSFDVIVQGNPKKLDKQEKVVGFVGHVLKTAQSDGQAGSLTQSFQSITGAELTVTGRAIMKLAKDDQVNSILANETVKSSAVQLPLYNTQLWPWAAGAAVDW